MINGADSINLIETRRCMIKTSPMSFSYAPPYANGLTPINAKDLGNHPDAASITP
jgi:hypothetical protein